MENERIKVILFKDSKDSFLPMLNEKGVKYSLVPVRPGVVMAAGETIEILKAFGEASPFAALAWVLVEWIKAKSSRKLIIQTKNKEIVHLEGYGIKEIEKLLDRSENITVIETKPNKSLNKDAP